MTRSVPNKKLVAALLPRRALTSAATPMIDLNPASYAAHSNAARTEYENEQLAAQVDALRAALRLIHATLGGTSPDAAKARQIAREALRDARH